jgi:hypothetical protein
MEVFPKHTMAWNAHVSHSIKDAFKQSYIFSHLRSTNTGDLFSVQHL